MFRGFALVVLGSVTLAVGLLGCNQAKIDLTQQAKVDVSDYPHDGKMKDPSYHSSRYAANASLCESCHGADLSGGTANVSCVGCHSLHASKPTTCGKCHSEDKPTQSHALVSTDCSTCHNYSTGMFSQLPSLTSSFSASGHANPAGAFSGHGSQSCARCHNLKGFRDYIGDDGSTEFLTESTTFTVPGPLDCTACHNSKTDTYINSGVGLKSTSGLTMNANREGFCVACHSGRTGEGKLKIDAAIAGQAPNSKMTGTYTYAQWPGNSVAGGTVSAATNRASAITPHYFPAAMVQYGSEAGSGYEYPGQTYTGKNPHVTGYNTCIGCHNPHTTEVKLTSCRTCHSNVNIEADLRNIRIHSTPDYDGDGDTSEGVAAELDGVKAKLLQAIQNYAAGSNIGVPIFYNATKGSQRFVTTDGGATSYSGANYTPVLLKATFNYVLADHDGGAFAHNSRYIIQLLYDSLKELNDQLDNGAAGAKVDMTGMYRPNP